MIPELVMNKAIEGGFDYKGGEITLWEQTALRPDFWQALGKNLGWDIIVPESSCVVCGEPMPKGEEMFKYHGYSQECTKPPLHSKHWADEAKRFYDLILQGKDTTDYWNNILGI